MKKGLQIALRSWRDIYGPAGSVTFDIWNHSVDNFVYHFEDGATNLEAYVHSPIAPGARVNHVIPSDDLGDASVVPDNISWANSGPGEVADATGRTTLEKKLCLHIFGTQGGWVGFWRAFKAPAPLAVGIFKPILALDGDDTVVGLNAFYIDWSPALPADPYTPTQYQLWRSAAGPAFNPATAVQVNSVAAADTNQISDDVTGIIADYWYQVRAVTPFGIAKSDPILVHSLTP